MKSRALTASVEPGVLAIGQDAWDGLVRGNPENTPFLDYRFLASLEEAGTLGERVGWIPQFVVVHRGDKLVAAAPAYVKLNSQGEFVYDFAFADLANRSGIPYYPKLLVAVPFTPATGPRLLTASGEDRAELLPVLGGALMALVEELQVHGLHLNFARDDEIAAMRDVGMMERHSVQYHWRRQGADTFEGYLARFNSKRRNVIKREMRGVADEGLTLETVRGDGLDEPGLIDTAFKLYLTTIEKFSWGRQYLNAKFFHLVSKRMRDHFEIVVARDAQRQIIAGAINFASPTTLYGRYWGAFEERRFLHFNVCYYQGIADCIARGIDTFEPGAGGEHKRPRGFDPTVTKSVHWFRNPRFAHAIDQYVTQERASIARAIESGEEEGED